MSIAEIKGTRVRRAFRDKFISGYHRQRIVDVYKWETCFGA